MRPRFTFRHQYDEEADEAVGRATQVINTEDSLTVQGPALDADINEIMRRFGVTDGSIPPVPISREEIDWSDVPDLRRAMDITNDAVNKFNALPANIREFYDNDPRKLHDAIFGNDPLKLDAAVKLGLLKVEEPPPAPPAVT